jgi:hypothetical protein
MSRVYLPAVMRIKNGKALIAGWMAIVTVFTLGLLEKSRFSSFFWSQVFKGSIDIAIPLLVVGYANYYVRSSIRRLPRLSFPI